MKTMCMLKLALVFVFLGVNFDQVRLPFLRNSFRISIFIILIYGGKSSSLFVSLSFKEGEIDKKAIKTLAKRVLRCCLRGAGKVSICRPRSIVVC